MKLPRDIGLPSRVYADVVLASALEKLAPHTELVEISSFGLHTVLSRRNRAAALASGLRLTIHGPTGLDILPGSPDEGTRRRAIAAHRRHLEAAAEIGAEVYLVHPDYGPTPEPRDPAVVAALQRTVADLERAQHETGVRIVVENMPSAGCSHFVAPGDLNLGALGFALDAGHAAISGTLTAFLRDPRVKLAHVHLHDNDGVGDLDDPHRALGDGVVDAGAVLARARADGARVILEHSSEAFALRSIAYLEARGLIGEPRGRA